MTWLLVGSGLRLAFFLRVPLLTLLVLAAFGPISQLAATRPLLGNLFDQQDDAGLVWNNVFAVSFCAFLLAFTAITTLNLALHYGALRFSENLGGKFAPAPTAASRFEMCQKRPGLTFTLGSLAACVFVGTVIYNTGRENAFRSTSAALVAFASAFGLALLAKVVQLALTDPAVTGHPPPFLIFPAYRWPWLEARFDDLYCWPSEGSRSKLANFVRRTKSGFSRLSQRPYSVVSGAAQGYLVTVPAEAGSRLKLASGHVFALTLAVLAFLIYIGVGFDKARITAAPAVFPALAYVLLFFMVMCWLLSALTFFFDRYHFPLLASIVCLISLTATVPQSDHFFRVETVAAVPKLKSLPPQKFQTPGAYLAARATGAAPHRLILVATPGGGIQAAAWTAQVLQRLDEKFPDQNKLPGFRRSVGLISSVSGGSLGSLIYAASFAGNVKPGCVAANARASAIDEVAWGWTAPDFWRTVIPLFRSNLVMDRGWALEQKWAVINGLSPEPYCAVCKPPAQPDCTGHNQAQYLEPLEDDTYLSDWAARGTGMPALVFNSMLVERGQHVVFSTTRFPRPNDVRGIVNFYDLYPDVAQAFDIRVNTAARLSASFPYVAPASRPNLESLYAPDFHFVDGGYYDNLGIDSVIGWLTDAYREVPTLARNFPEVLILQIRHFNPAAQPRGSRRGWGFQTFAPILALLQMWNNAPIHRDQNELDLFVQSVANSPAAPAIRSVTIPYCGLDYSSRLDPGQAFDACIAAAGGRPLSSTVTPVNKTVARSPSERNGVNCAEPPLSWKLTKAQKTCIDDTWNAFAEADPNGALRGIGDFLYAEQSSKTSR